MAIISIEKQAKNTIFSSDWIDSSSSRLGYLFTERKKVVINVRETGNIIIETITQKGFQHFISSIVKVVGFGKYQEFFSDRSIEVVCVNSNEKSPLDKENLLAIETKIVAEVLSEVKENKQIFSIKNQIKIKFDKAILKTQLAVSEHIISTEVKNNSNEQSIVEMFQISLMQPITQKKPYAKRSLPKENSIRLIIPSKQQRTTIKKPKNDDLSSITFRNVDPTVLPNSLSEVRSNEDFRVVSSKFQSHLISKSKEKSLIIANLQQIPQDTQRMLISLESAAPFEFHLLIDELVKLPETIAFFESPSSDMSASGIRSFVIEAAETHPQVMDALIEFAYSVKKESQRLVEEDGRSIRLIEDSKKIEELPQATHQSTEKIVKEIIEFTELTSLYPKLKEKVIKLPSMDKQLQEDVAELPSVDEELKEDVFEFSEYPTIENAKKEKSKAPELTSIFLKTRQKVLNSNLACSYESFASFPEFREALSEWFDHHPEAVKISPELKKIQRLISFAEINETANDDLMVFLVNTIAQKVMNFTEDLFQDELFRFLDHLEKEEWSLMYSSQSMIENFLKKHPEKDFSVVEKIFQLFECRFEFFFTKKNFEEIKKDDVKMFILKELNLYSTSQLTENIAETAFIYLQVSLDKGMPKDNIFTYLLSRYKNNPDMLESIFLYIFNKCYKKMKKQY